MKRYYLSGVAGNGSGESEFRPILADHAGSWSGAIPCNPSTGIPTQSWVLVSCTDADQSGLSMVAGINPLPDCPPEAAIEDMASADRLLVSISLTAHGINSAMVSLCLTYSDLLARLQHPKLAPSDAIAQLTL